MRVLVVDDHPLFRAGVVHELERSDGVVAEGAPSVLEALTLLEQRAFDVVLMDVRLPGVDGIEGCRRVRCIVGGPPVVMLSTYDEPLVIDAAREADASAFVSKEVPVAELLETLQRVADGTRFFGAVGPQTPRLTPREEDVLRLLALGWSNREIAEDLGLGPETVKTHVENLLGKFEARDRVSLIRTLHRWGWEVVNPDAGSPERG